MRSAPGIAARITLTLGETFGALGGFGEVVSSAVGGAGASVMREDIVNRYAALSNIEDET